MNLLDTRDLKETRDELLSEINSVLIDYGVDEIDSFNTEDELKSHIENWTKENLKFLPEEYKEIDEYCETYDTEGFTEDVINEIDVIDGYLEIQQLETEIGSEFDYGVTLIDADDFEDYCQDLLEDCGYIYKDFPSWIVIDWAATASNIEVGYISVEYQGETYLYRN